MFLLGSIAIAAAPMVAPTGAMAATATATFQVTATVVATCSVSAANLAFGNYDATNGNAGSSQLSVTCTGGSNPYTVSLNAGTNGSLAGASTVRAMGDGSGHLLNYNLYSNVGATSVWADGTSAVAGTAAPNAALTVYGKIPAGQGTAPPGAYADTINVTMAY
jgi:spore coat protein U-like protein